MKKCIACNRPFNPSKSPYIDYGPTCGKRVGAEKENEAISPPNEESNGRKPAEFDEEFFTQSITRKDITEKEASDLYTDAKRLGTGKWNNMFALWRNRIGNEVLPRNAVVGMWRAGDEEIISHDNFPADKFHKNVLKNYHTQKEKGEEEADLILYHLAKNKNCPAEALVKIANCDQFSSLLVSEELMRNENTPPKVFLKAFHHVFEKEPHFHYHKVWPRALKLEESVSLKREMIKFLLKERAIYEVKDGDFESEKVLDVIDAVKQRLISWKQTINNPEIDSPPLAISKEQLEICEIIYSHLKSELENNPSLSAELKDLTKLLK